MRADLTAILRGYSPSEARDTALRAWACGFDVVEVPVQSPASWDALAAVLEAADGRAVGAGTVLTVSQVERAAVAGCTIIIAPNFSPAVLRACVDLGLEYWPGVMTPSEVATAIEAGAQMLKVFPARTLGAGFIRDLRGPFPDVRFIAVGGIDIDNASDFLDAGAVGVAFGSSITKALNPENAARLRELIERTNHDAPARVVDPRPSA